ncbi:hypothetical protein D9M72_259620 [compost metagenome]
MASLGPAATQAPGAFSAASETWGEDASRGASASAPSRTDSIVPAGCACMSAPRRAMSRAASSRRITPAITAATNSPTLWPISACGRRPSDSSRRASAYSSVKSAGCVTAVGASACGSSANRRSRRSKSSAPSKARTQLSNAAANTGSPACSARPMPGYCAPWPGNISTGCGARSAIRSLTRHAVFSERKASMACAASPATTARRKAWALRPTHRVNAASARQSPGCSSRCVASRCVATASAASERADSASTWTPGCVVRACRAGASSSTTCALVPPTPNELTPARRGRSARGHGCSWLLTWNGVRAKSIAGFGAVKCAVGGISSWCSDSAVLMRPAAPAAVTMWPTLLLSEPSVQ